MASEFAELYRSKLVSAKEAAALVPSGAKITMGAVISQPPATFKALAERAEAGEVEDLRLYYLLSSGIAGSTVMRDELSERIAPISFFHGGVERALDNKRVAEGRPLLEFLPTSFGRTPHIMIDVIKVDTLMATVSPMDENGYFSFGTNVDYSQPVSQTARHVILEVNPNMPRAYGNSTVHISQVTAIVEHETPLVELPSFEIGVEDRAIGNIVAGFIHDGDCLQMGIGALPDAICAALGDRKHLGVHTEMMMPGLMNLMKAGVVDNSRKKVNTGKSVYAFAAGSKELYEYLHENPLVEGHPVDYVNNPFVISQNDNVVSVNATIEVDLFGACNSEFLRGRQFSASGGQLDFVRGANYSKNGRSIIACHSTAAKGTASRIVPKLSGPVTTPRNDVHIIVTEHGYADLKGKTATERARALISIAHPQFREQLEQEAKALSLL